MLLLQQIPPLLSNAAERPAKSFYTGFRAKSSGKRNLSNVELGGVNGVKGEVKSPLSLTAAQAAIQNSCFVQFNKKQKNSTDIIRLECQGKFQ